MLILRCTHKLRKKNLGPLVGHEDLLVPTLGSWHANLIYLAQSPIVLCVNDRSLLSVLVRGRQFVNILPVIKSHIAERLRRIGLSAELLAIEQEAMGIVDVQPSNSKSVLGSMNDLAYGLKVRVENELNIGEIERLEDILAETPMGALNYEYPIEVASRLLGIPKSCRTSIR